MSARGRSPLLAIDTGSSQPSVALSSASPTPLVRIAEPRASSESLLGLIDELLEEARLSPRQLGGVVALRGPGSFTGLRVGLATALGLHHALGVPAAAVGTFEVLARAGSESTSSPRFLTVVDALRDHWYVAGHDRDDPSRPLVEPRRVTSAEVAELVAAERIGALVGISADRLGSAIAFDGEVVCPTALAPVAVRLALDRSEWDAAALHRPLYLRGPAVTPPR